MNETGHPIWILLIITSLVPLATAGELVAAIFSKRVRAYIARHQLAHVLLFGFAVLCVLFLIPMRSGPHHPY